MGPDNRDVELNKHSSTGAFRFSIPNRMLPENSYGSPPRLDSNCGIAYLAKTCVVGLGEREFTGHSPSDPSAHSRWNMNNPLQTQPIGITDSHELSDLEKPEQGLELHIGSNVFRNTSGVIKFQGKEQMVLEIRTSPLSLLLTMDFYNDQGARIAHVRRNTLSAHSAVHFIVHTEPDDETASHPTPTVRVIDRSTNQSVFEACLIQQRKIRITTGHFRTHKGELVAITTHYCRIGASLTLFGSVAENRGGVAAIG